tara:strand:- start:641 stop:1039 length:399 start_codon:yes stop_codon:yes gene_type:complete
MKNLFIGIIFIIFSSLAAHADSNSDGNKVCTGFAKWTEDGEFKTIRSKCITEKEYQTMLNSPDYLCKYYQKSIWKESERAYGKKQYKYTDEILAKIKSLKDEGAALCDSGKRKQGEAKLVEAIKIISHTMMN